MEIYTSELHVYTSELHESVAKIMLKCNHVDYFKSLIETVYQNLSLVDACELSRFTF